MKMTLLPQGAIKGSTISLSYFLRGSWNCDTLKEKP